MHPTNLDDSSDKRSHFRLDTVLPITYCIEGDVEQPLPQPIRVNLSVGGIGLVVQRQLAVGTTLSVTLFLPSGAPIQAQAKVVREAPAPRAGVVPTVGLQFTTLAERDRERINSHIFQLQIERRRTRYQV